ncbi:MAG: glycosyltransferase [Rubrivivax sp.]|nr:glycosyltransferase [Rubrivivax sp.]
MKRMGISLGNLGNLHDGLGEFALQTGQAVAAVAAAWREQHGVVFDFHLRAQFDGLFGRDVGYLPIDRWQRLRHVRREPYALWHSLHQLNKTLPPQGAGTRLVTVHDLNYLYGHGGFSRWRHHRRTLALIRRTDHVVAISAHTAADVQKHLHWRGPLDVILRGARPFASTQQQQPLPGWPRDSEAPFLFHLSRMSPSKNPQAIVALARIWPEMRFVFCGPEGDDSRALRDSVALPNVEFHFNISDTQKAWAFARCAGFLFPSFTEGFGLPPIEAMQFGTPVFLSRLTSLPEIGGTVADYFDCFEPEAMKAVVQAGLARHRSDPRHAQALRDHAARFDADQVAGEYLTLYRRLLQF